MSETKAPRPQKSRIVGIDFGMARIGVALSDESKIIATPLFVVRTERRMEDTVAKLLEELHKHATENKYTIESIVVGMPFMMSGKKGPIADAATTFVDEIQQQVTIPVVPWDERLTTVQAERSLLESSLTRKRRAAVVDTVAATIILQSFLDNKSIRTR